MKSLKSTDDTDYFGSKNIEPWFYINSFLIYWEPVFMKCFFFSCLISKKGVSLLSNLGCVCGISPLKELFVFYRVMTEASYLLFCRLCRSTEAFILLFLLIYDLSSAKYGAPSLLFKLVLHISTDTFFLQSSVNF